TVGRAAAIVVAVLRFPRARPGPRRRTAGAGRRIRAEGWTALWPPFLVRRGDGVAAEGARAERARRRRRAVCVFGPDDQRTDRPVDGCAVMAGRSLGLA